MKKVLILLFLTIAVNCPPLSLWRIFDSLSLWADSPKTISYQGRLRESGQPVSGTRSIQFKLFDASSAGTAVFDSDPQSIYVSSGIFGYQLGSNKAAGYPNFKDLSWATSSYWLEISVGGNAMSPREQINAMPYAFMSSTAASLNGSGNIQITGAGPHYIANGNVGIGTTEPVGLFQVGGGSLTVLTNGNVGIGTTNPVGLFQVAGGTLTVLSSGNVGIGKTNPGAALDVEGTIESKVKGGLWESLTRNMSYSPYNLNYYWLISVSDQKFLNTDYVSLSNTNTRFTLNKAGWYRVYVELLWDNVTNGVVYRLHVHTNRTEPETNHLERSNTGQTYVYVNDTAMVYSDGDDYIEFSCECDNTTADFYIYALQLYNQLMIEYIGR